MSSPAALIATAKVRAGSEDAFAAWKARHDAALAKFPGFISSDIMPPDKHSDMWTIILNFRSTSELTAWQQSKERAAIIGELLPLVAGGNFGEVMNREASDSAQPETTVTQVILSQVKPGWKTRTENGAREFKMPKPGIPAIGECISSRQHRTVAIGLRCCVSILRNIWKDGSPLPNGQNCSRNPKHSSRTRN